MEPFTLEAMDERLDILGPAGAVSAMGPPQRLASRLLALLILLPPALPAESPSIVLLHDDFTGLTPGMFSAGVIGAQIEYHYLTVASPRGGWAVSNFRSEGSQRAWRVIEE